MSPLSRPGRARALHLAAAVAASVGLAACGGDSGAAEAEAAENVVILAPTDLAEARTGEVATGVLLTGSLQPADRVTVTAQVSGTTGRVHVDRGDRVSNGQLLATIEAEGVRSQAAGARAGVEAARANVAVAERERDASRALFEQGAISELEYRRTEAALEAARAQLASAQAQAAGAGEQAGRTNIRAPMAGVISDRQVEPGEAVSVGDPLFEVVDSRMLELSGRVPVELAQRVRVGQPVTFTLDAYPGRTFQGRVDRIDPVADAQTRQVGIYVQLPNRDGELIGGQFARGRVVGERLEDVLVIPEGAVRGTGENRAVLAVEDGRIVRRPVELGARDEVQGVVVVRQGLEPGAQVLATPGTAVAEGTRVRVEQQRGGIERDTAGRPATPVGGASGGSGSGEGTSGSASGDSASSGGGR